MHKRYISKSKDFTESNNLQSAKMFFFENRGNGHHQLGCLCVVPAYQGMGIRTQAFPYMLSLCPDWKQITLVTPSDKGRNLKFYTKKCGFDIGGREMNGNVEVMERKTEIEFGGKKMDCTIRKWRLTDAGELAANLSNKKVLDNLRDGVPYPYTVKDAQAYITAMINADPDQTFAFAIVSDDKVIGSISVFRCENIHYRTAELGYYIGESYWGKGITTSAVQQICEYVFSHSNILRIFAEPFSHNIASCRVLEKAGFQFEGLLQKNAVKNGEIVDMKLYALVRSI